MDTVVDAYHVVLLSVKTKYTSQALLTSISANAKIAIILTFILLQKKRHAFIIVGLLLSAQAPTLHSNKSHESNTNYEPRNCQGSIDWDRVAVKGSVSECVQTGLGEIDKT